MKTPFQKQVRKAYLSTPVGKLERLLAEERRWQSKHTFARNKLMAARARTNEFTRGLAKEVLELTTAGRPLPL